MHKLDFGLSGSRNLNEGVTKSRDTEQRVPDAPVQTECHVQSSRFIDLQENVHFYRNLASIVSLDAKIVCKMQDSLPTKTYRNADL